MKENRNITIDILKVIGILLVILAHVEIPKVIFQLRNFEVPLLMIASGILAVHSYGKCKNSIEYFMKRIKRLILPTWIFLILFFIIDFLCEQKYIHNKNSIIDSFLLTGGIGYVWIIRIYILNALSIPILIKLKTVLHKKLYYCIILVLYVIYELIFLKFGNANNFLKYFIYYIVPYGFVCTSLGIELKEIKKRNIFIIGIILMLIFVGLSVSLYIERGQFIITNEYKYPPRLYYLSYAIGVSLLIYYLIDKVNILNIKERCNIEIIKFISSHTMWIYLWHIMYIYFLGMTDNNINWIYKYIIVVAGAIITTYIQSKVANKVFRKNSKIKLILDC